MLILGSFLEERKAVLEALREELRKYNYLPIMFDFPPSANQTTVETIKILANMARFVLADLSDARSVLQELESIVPVLPSVAVRLRIKKSEPKYGMLEYIRKYRSVVRDSYEYDMRTSKKRILSTTCSPCNSIACALIASIRENIIVPAEEKVRELRSQD